MAENTRVCKKRQVIFCGSRAFLRGNSLESVENKQVVMAARLQFFDRWGRRAEDPFRGLRAGPVRFSPQHFCRSVSRNSSELHQATPKTPRENENAAGVFSFLVGAQHAAPFFWKTAI